MIDVLEPRDRLGAPPRLSTPYGISGSRSSDGNTRSAASTPKGYRFADAFSVARVLNNSTVANRFLQQYLEQEVRFFAITRDPTSALTFDGVNLDPATGRVIEMRTTSAASKECLDLAVWIKALYGNRLAATLVACGDVRAAKQRAAKVLGAKLDAWWRFQEEYPGYGGFLPWFTHTGEGKIAPADGWTNSAPGLDNAEWAWALFTAEKALRHAGHEALAERYHAYNEMLRTNVVSKYFDPARGKVLGDNFIPDPREPNGGTPRPGETRAGRVMDGPHGVHEGMMLYLYLSLLGKGLPEGAADRIWDDVDMQRVESPWGTTWQGFWGSAHESWAYLLLPIRDLPEYRDLFRIREKIRTQDAVRRGYPGLAASISAPGKNPDPGYVSDCGIEGINSEPVGSNHIFAFYATFPLLLEFASQRPESAKNYGLAWLLNMLHAPKAQGPMGSGESGTNDGRQFAPMKTMDGSVPIYLGMMGGVANETAEALREEGLYDRFCHILRRLYGRSFGATPLREPVGFASPREVVPHGFLPEFDFGGSSPREYSSIRTHADIGRSQMTQ